MRSLLAACAVLAAASTAHASGAYTSASAADAAACARRCSDDGLCVAWAYRAENTCELRATAPAQQPTGAWGFSSRATPAMRQVFVNPIPVAAMSEPPSNPSPAPAPTRRQADESGLLGGLESEPSVQAELRLSLRN